MCVVCMCMSYVVCMWSGVCVLMKCIYVACGMCVLCMCSVYGVRYVCIGGVCVHCVCTGEVCVWCGVWCTCVMCM